MTQVYKSGVGNETVLEVNATAANETVLLPSGFATGRKFTLRRVDTGGSGHTVTVTIASGQTMDGVVDGSFTVGPNVEGWMVATDPGIWESYNLRTAAGSTVTVDADGSLVVDGTTVEIGTDAENATNFGPIVGSDAWLKLHAGGNLDALIVGVVTRDGNGAATSAGVVWPDAVTGTYTATTVSSAFPGAVDAYTVTYVGATTKTVTQSAVTRDSSSGAVTTRPAMTVA